MDTKCVYCKEKTPTRKCTLCQAMIYCGDECARKDWIKHQNECPNVYNVPPGCTVAYPYHYEEYLTDKDLHGTDVDSLYSEKIMLRTRHSDYNTQPRIQAKFLPDIPRAKTEQVWGNLGVGEVPNTKAFGQYYRITVSADEYSFPSGKQVPGDLPKLSVVGEIPKDMIFKGNLQNPMADTLAQSRSSRGNAEKLLFWPPIDQVRLKRFHIKTEGGWINVSVELFENAEALEKNEVLSKASMDFVYQNIQFKGFGGALKRGRKFFGKKKEQMMYKKLPPENHAALRAKDDKSSMEVRMIFKTTGKGPTKRVEDIEVLVPIEMFEAYQGEVIRRYEREIAEKRDRPAYSQKEEQLVQTLRDVGVSSRLRPFTCDPSDLDYVTGLYQAIEENIGELKEELQAKNISVYDRDALRNTLSSFQTVAATINDHRLALEKDNSVKPSYEVKPAIRMAEKLTWERIERRGKPAFAQKFYEDNRDADLDDLQDIINTQLGPPEEEGNIFQRGKRWITGKRGKEKGRARAIKRILKERRGMTTNPKDLERIRKMISEVNKIIGSI